MNPFSPSQTLHGIKIRPVESTAGASTWVSVLLVVNQVEFHSERLVRQSTRTPF
jgi:hypothetical protein